MTRGLTGGDERYIEAYWSDFEGVWNHDDWVEIDEDGFWSIPGRADDTMNISGRRVTAHEIEEAILGHPDAREAAVIDVQDERGNTVPVAFITVADGAPDTVPGEVRDYVADTLGAPFRPAVVYVVDVIPRTQSEKIPRSRIKTAYVDGEVGDVSTLENGDALHAYPRAD